MDVKTRRPVLVLGERIEQRLERVGGRERLRAELRSLAVDLIGHWEHDELDPESRALIGRGIDAAVAASIEPLVARFSVELARGLIRLPEDLREDLIRAEIRRELGYD